MAAQRPSDGKIHPSRQRNLPSAKRKKSGKPKKNPKHPKVISPEETASIGALKNEIRNLTRLLELDAGLPANIRMEKERALAKYKLDLEELKESRRAKETLSKYHMVRFFERKKAERQLKKGKTILSNTSPDSEGYEQIKKAAHEAEVDLNYTMYSPLAEKYASLWPKDKTQGGQQEKDLHTEGSKPEMWYIVERAMAEGTLDSIRNWSRPMAQSTSSETQPSMRTKLGKGEETTALESLRRLIKRSTHIDSDKAKAGTSVETKAEAAEEGRDEEMSDGGFFEE